MILKKIKEIVANHFEIDMYDLTSNSKIKDEGDSLDIMEIIMEIENEFDITLDESELDNLETLGQLAEYVESVLR